MLTFDLRKAPVPAGRDGCRAAPHVNNIEEMMDTKETMTQSQVLALGGIQVSTRPFFDKLSFFEGGG